MTAVTAPVMDQLKASTTELHAAAEGHAFQRSLVRGSVDRALYARYLGQMLAIHEALEGHLEQMRREHPFVATVVTDDQFHSPRIRQDLASLGVDPASIDVGSAAQVLVMEINACGADPHALLGHHYVLEGSMNGNKYIARALMQGMGLRPGAGLSYFDPYAERQRELWQNFKVAMNAADFSQAQIDVAIDAACAMFRGIGRVSEELMSTPR